MSCNSMILVANQASADIPDGGLVPLGTVVRRFGQNCQLSGNGIVCQGSGYYNVDGVVCVIPAAAGTAVLTLLSDGVPVPGGVSSHTVAAADTTIPLPLVSAVRNRCCDDAQTLTIQISGVDVELVSSSLRVTKD